MKFLLLSITLLSCINFCFAQFTPPTRINTPYGAVTVKGNYNPQFFNHQYYQRIPSSKHDYSVELKNGEVIEVRSKIHFQDSISYLKWKVDGETKTLFPQETKKIYFTNKKYQAFNGLAVKDRWVFLLKYSNINTYTITPDHEVVKVITHIQKGDLAEIVEFTADNLKKMISDNPAAVKLLEKNKLEKALNEYNKR